MNLTHKESTQKSTHLVWCPTAGLIFYHSTGLEIGCGSSRSHCQLKSHSLWSRTRLHFANTPSAGICWMCGKSHAFHQCGAPHPDTETQDRALCPSTQARDPQGCAESSCRAGKHSGPLWLCVILPKTLEKEKRGVRCRQWMRWPTTGQVQVMPCITRIKKKPLLLSCLKEDPLRQRLSDLRGIRVTGKSG